MLQNAIKIFCPWCSTSCIQAACIAMICCLANLSCRFGTSTTLCDGFDVRCSPGQVCATKMEMGAQVGVCVDIGGCGDHEVAGERGEECDDGNLDDGDGCDHNCLPSGCGNGVITGSEKCDDGNFDDGDGCDRNCTPTGCGNNIKTVPEECDGSDRNPSEVCSSSCKLEWCGNSIIDKDIGEECDLGDKNLDQGSCTKQCRLAGCGDHLPYTGTEECDDGNSTDGDGCDNNCTASRCGNGIPVTPGEECDDGNDIDGDGCDNNCTASRCNNGIQTQGEACDDGNAMCGTCDAGCSVSRYDSAKADIKIRVPADADKFKINNGWGIIRVFEFDTNGDSQQSSVSINISSMNKFQARDALVLQINLTGSLDVIAYIDPSNTEAILHVENIRNGRIDVDLVKIVDASTDSEILSDSRGWGADCILNEACSDNLDCKSNSCNSVTHLCL